MDDDEMGDDMPHDTSLPPKEVVDFLVANAGKEITISIPEFGQDEEGNPTGMGTTTHKGVLVTKIEWLVPPDDEDGTDDDN